MQLAGQAMLSFHSQNSFQAVVLSHQRRFMDADNKNTLPDVQSARDGRNIVCIDPGHGGIDLGNVRVVDDEIVLQEKDLTLAHSLALAERLRDGRF